MMKTLTLLMSSPEQGHEWQLMQHRWPTLHGCTLSWVHCLLTETSSAHPLMDEQQSVLSADTALDSECSTAAQKTAAVLSGDVIPSSRYSNEDAPCSVYSHHAVLGSSLYSSLLPCAAAPQEWFAGSPQCDAQKLVQEHSSLVIPAPALHHQRAVPLASSCVHT